MIAGAPTGATIGGTICKSHGVLGVVGGSVAGLVSGAVAGWLYALVVMFLLSVIGVLCRAALRRPDTTPSESDMEMMTPITIRGIILGVLAAMFCGFTIGWVYAIAVALAIGFVTALVAVARCELR